MAITANADVSDPILDVLELVKGGVLLDTSLVTYLLLKTKGGNEDANKHGRLLPSSLP